MTLFGVAAIIAPIVGPTLGGWICVNYDWRWVFLINVQIGLLSLAIILAGCFIVALRFQDEEDLRSPWGNSIRVRLELSDLGVPVRIVDGYVAQGERHVVHADVRAVAGSGIHRLVVLPVQTRSLAMLQRTEYRPCLPPALG